MKNIEEQLNMLQKTTMNAEEKGAIRDTVISHMQENPLLVRNSGDSRLHYRTAQMPNGNYKLITKKNMTIAIIIALLLGGGTSFAAEGALPGDVLYPIKIHVNENMQELVAVSSEAEARVQAKLAERRLEEVEKLAVEGKLTVEISADLKVRFEEHAEKSKEHRRKVEEQDNADTAEDMSSDIEVSLRMHQKLLEDIGDASIETEGLIKGILEGVRHHRKETGEKRASMEERAFTGEGTDAKTAVEGAMKSAQNKIDEVVKFLDAKKDILSAHVLLEAHAYLKEANAAMAEGKAKMVVPAYKDAFALFKKAARKAQEAKIFAATAGELKVELRHQSSNDRGGEDKRNESKMKDGCFVGGCTNEICADVEMSSGCVSKPEFVCYKEAVCERQANGRCGWTETKDLKECLQSKSNARVETELELTAEEDARITDFPPGVSVDSDTKIRIGL